MVREPGGAALPVPFLRAGITRSSRLEPYRGNPRWIKPLRQRRGFRFRAWAVGAAGCKSPTAVSGNAPGREELSRGSARKTSDGSNPEP
ncbi:hypothetical protein Sfum_3523 [Syntrophobacter fumaroxidans MPOB]|uniref:Uncharacterized protein n=1 Tax=Syntrophobacter fumaroxidans (strain DSM 10017 / MPOB) TaxID=335543 RepID=A0LP41_SYNFM|nr:hypothetical protein Sfum_3523 [Syntrophobacter fumaroxidans MPOB]